MMNERSAMELSTGPLSKHESADEIKQGLLSRFYSVPPKTGLFLSLSLSLQQGLKYMSSEQHREHSEDFPGFS